MLRAGAVGLGRGVAIEGTSMLLGGGVGRFALKGLILKSGVRRVAGFGLSGGAAGFGATLGRDLYNVGALGRDWSSPEEYVLSTGFGVGLIMVTVS